MSHHHPYQYPRHICALLALCLGALLAACDRNGRAVAQQVDATTIAATERSVQTLTPDPRQASHAVGQGFEAVADPAINASRDAAITAEVNAQLARDEALSAVHIDVDTSAGQVVLRGSVPDTAARARATDLAGGVDGVVSVRNDLMVQLNVR
jgi:osmotically-inducible protein OsmY